MSILTVTDNALHQIKYLITQRNKPTLGIRVGVKSGGCSGYKYFIEYADNKEPYDEVICIDDDITILISPKAIMYLIGSEMDYTTEQFKSGFIFRNPNEKSTCGCKKSFSV